MRCFLCINKKCPYKTIYIRYNQANGLSVIFYRSKTFAFYKSINVLTMGCEIKKHSIFRHFGY